MTTMIVEIYDALRDAGASDDKARRAAEAMAGHENRFNSLENKLDRMEAALNQRIDRLEASLRAEIAALRTEIAGIRGEQVLIRWMLGTLLAVNVAILLKVVFH